MIHRIGDVEVYSLILLSAGLVQRYVPTSSDSGSTKIEQEKCIVYSRRFLSEAQLSTEDLCPMPT